MPKHHKLIILGSGPAGCTAAIYAARANLEPAVITGLELGGRLVKATKIENWPGEDKGISGIELMEKIIIQAKRFGSKIISASISQTNLLIRPFLLKGDSDEYTCDVLIIATGTSAKYLGVKSEQKYIGRGISSCVLCDGSFYKNKKVAIVGSGNHAAENALYLAKISSDVIIINRSNNLRATPKLVEQLRNTPNIKLEFDYVVEEILGNEYGVIGLKIKNISSNLTKEIEAEGVFVAMGYKPNTELFIGQLEMDQDYIKVSHGSKTSIDGVFAAGDVTTQNYHQAITAAGSGCIAALDAKSFLIHSNVPN